MAVFLVPQINDKNVGVDLDECLFLARAIAARKGVEVEIASGAEPIPFDRYPIKPETHGK